MGVLSMNTDGAGGEGFSYPNNYNWDEQNGVRNVGVYDGQGLVSSEDRATEETDDGSAEAIQVPACQQDLLSQDPVIHWESFLPTRSLKVLLVENDDSTRHIVSALLRNCSYEVMATANGLQAWKILEDLTNHIDLVLTELVMPFLSGIGLLCKIMSHKTLKNIPVIMTSSHDSMGLVFKCLSKGAVDFLVKPIRKNELKNLWQHVWRRYHSSSGGGSESGTQTKKSAKSMSSDESENNTGCSDEHHNGSIGLSIQDGSDKGSGTQSPWTKRSAEVDSPRPVSPCKQFADGPDSSCALVIHTKPEKFSNRFLHVTETKEFQEQGEQLANAAVSIDLEIDVSRNPDMQLQYQQKISAYLTSRKQNKLSEMDSLPLEKEQLDRKNENVESQAIDAPSDLSGVSQIKSKGSYDFGEMPSLELTLKRMRGVGDSAQDDCNVLRHSDLSAFSKYKTASSAYQASAGNSGSCSLLGNSSVAMKTETMHNSNCTPLRPVCNEIGNNNDMASSMNCITKPEALNDKSESVSAFKCAHSSSFQRVHNGHVCGPQLLISGNADFVGTTKDQIQASGLSLRFQIQHYNHHYLDHNNMHAHCMKHQSRPGCGDLLLKNMTADAPQCLSEGPPESKAGNNSVNGSASGSNCGSNLQSGSSTASNPGAIIMENDRGDFLLKNMAGAASQCGSSNVPEGPIEGNAGNYSVNESTSGSKSGSNLQNGSSTDLNPGVTNMENDKRTAGHRGVIGTSDRISIYGALEDHTMKREAALYKFRQKRKDRCFEKKVRYQSRKRLAEQRPRVRGQFVRQAVSHTRVDEESQDHLAPKENSCDAVQ